MQHAVNAGTGQRCGAGLLRGAGGVQLDLAPTASTTAMLALGDALAIAVSLRKGFRAEDFANLHPGGKLGKRLLRVAQLMHTAMLYRV